MGLEGATGVILDVDGVLIDSNSLHMEAIAETLSRMRLSLNLADMKGQVLGRRTEEWVHEALGEHAGGELRELVEGMKEAAFRKLLRERGQAVAGVRRFLSSLEAADIPIALGTSASRENVDAVLERLGLTGRFEHIVDASQVRRGKPAPDVFLQAAEALERRIDRCVVFEDSVVGLEAGRRAGAFVVGVATTLSFEDLSSADWIIRDFRGVTAQDVVRLVPGPAGGDPPGGEPPGRVDAERSSWETWRGRGDGGARCASGTGKGRRRFTGGKERNVTLSREWRAKQQKYDKANMAEVIDRFSQQLRGALEVELPELPEGDFGEVVVVGMGGSALPVDVITCAYDEELRVPLRVWRNYGLPKDVRDDTLIILSSFSGGTEEVLEALEEMEGRSRTVVISAGGELTERARRRELPVIRLPIEHEPEGFQPRSAVGYFVALLYRTLLRTNLIVGSERELTETSEFLEGVDSWREAEEASEWLQDKIPIIYTDRMYVSAVARIAKIKFNENAKVPAFFNELPEANHNELTGFLGDLGTFGIFLLHSAESHPMIWERFCVMQETFMAKGIENVAFRSWTMPGKTRLQRILASLLFMEQCSYLLALRRHVDPSPVELVEEFKARLAGVRTSSGTS